MLNDALDILNPHTRFTAEATFWKERPDSVPLAESGGVKFNYEYINPASRAYRRLYANIQVHDAGETAIRTNDILPYDSKCFFMTADGSLYQIVDVQEDFSVAPKQVMRLLGTPLGVEYLIRGVRVKNTWGAK